MKLNKKIVYTIEAELEFDVEDTIDINEILDTLRGVGSAKIVDVKIIDGDNDESVY